MKAFHNNFFLSNKLSRVHKTSVLITQNGIAVWKLDNPIIESFIFKKNRLFIDIDMSEASFYRGGAGALHLCIDMNTKLHLTIELCPLISGTTKICLLVPFFGQN